MFRRGLIYFPCKVAKTSDLNKLKILAFFMETSTMKYRNDIYIGEHIKRRCQEKNISIAQFAKEIHCSRATVYNIFAAKSIDIDRLIRISDALDYLFLEEYLPKNTPTESIHVVLDIEIKDGKTYIKQIE